MKVKYVFFLILLVIFFTQTVFGGNHIRKGSLLFTGEVAIFDEHHGIFALGGNTEYGISKNFTIGGDVCFVTMDNGPDGLLLAPALNYYFNINERDLDVFVGGGFYMFTYFHGDPELRLNVHGGIHYYFSRKWAGTFRLIAGGSGFGGAVGATYRIK